MAEVCLGILLLVQLCKGTFFRNALALLPLSGCFVLYSGFAFLEQKCGAEHLQCLSPAGQAEKKAGGGGGQVLSRQCKIPHKHLTSNPPRGASAPGSYKILWCSLNTEEKQVWEYLSIPISFSCFLHAGLKPLS